MVEADAELLHTEHAEALSRTSERASAPFLMPLHRGLEREGSLNSIFKMGPVKKFVQGEK